MLDYVYAAVWMAMALLLIIRFGKENVVFYPAGAFFMLLAGCWLVRPLLGINLFSGPASWGLRLIIAVILVMLCIAYYRESKKNRDDDDGKGEGQ